MKEDVKAFCDYLSKNKDEHEILNARIKAASELSKEEIAERIIIPFAKEKGYEFTIDDIKEPVSEGEEIDFEELDSISGGASFSRPQSIWGRFFPI